VEGLRSLIITGWDVKALMLCLAFALAFALLGMIAAQAALRTRVVRA
jgi:hypothetical protein